MTAAANPRAIPGHNAAPDALDDILAKAAALTDQAARVPSPLPDLDTAQRAVALVKMLRIAGQKVEEARKELQKPHKVEADAIMARARGPVAELADAEAFVGKLVHSFRMVHEIPEIVSDFGPKAYARAVPGDVIVDTALVPREFMVPDEKMIRAALARGETIAGVTVAEPTETTVIS